jgi:methanogenic corrinoid protein MtbC1
MPQDDHQSLNAFGEPHSRGASQLAENAVSLLNQRQATTAAGARQFILDHLLRSVTNPTHFDAGQMLDELRGHRLSTDSVIDIYVPAVARILGEMWEDDVIDFAAVTVGSMRLQSLLSIASAEALDFLRPSDASHYMLITVPLGEQHFLGAFVLAAQLRRLGARVELSFCESPPDFVSRVICDTPDMILFSASCKASLETVSRLVLDVSNVLERRPLIAVGGGATQYLVGKEGKSGIDLITNKAKDALTFVAHEKRRLSGQAKK